MNRGIKPVYVRDKSGTLGGVGDIAPCIAGFMKPINSAPPSTPPLHHHSPLPTSSSMIVTPSTPKPTTTKPLYHRVPTLLTPFIGQGVLVYDVTVMVIPKIQDCNLPGSGISFLLAVATFFTSSGNSSASGNSIPSSGNALCILFPTSRSFTILLSKYGSTRPVEDLDLLLWGDLNTMFKPHVEDQIKERLKTARSRQKSYGDKRRKPFEFKVGDRVLLKVSTWKGVVRFGKKGKLASRYVGPFKIVDCVGLIAYRLKLPQELSCVHDTFYVSNLKKCLAEPDAQVPLDEIEIDENLHFIEEPIEIVERDVKKLKRKRIPLVKVRWNSRQGAEYTWERED
uniref:Putative reverse transcriptase domain-containing protein n=1 Tax=Tanacetum cinerariifolium TaxID=118510 RepID=A0A6L2NDH2_TANCI|nr:putative reverse transcriptase domain-containing protein [Tanacetum cinerariifolium]